MINDNIVILPNSTREQRKLGTHVQTHVQSTVFEVSDPVSVGYTIYDETDKQSYLLVMP